MTTTIRLSQIIRTNKVWLVMMWSSSHLFLWVPKRDLGQDQDYYFFLWKLKKLDRPLSSIDSTPRRRQSLSSIARATRQTVASTRQIKIRQLECFACFESNTLANGLDVKSDTNLKENERQR